MEETDPSLEVLKEISGKLDLLAGIIAIQGKDQQSQLDVLHRLGWKSETIGDLLGLTPGYVRTWKSRKARQTK